MPDDDGANNRKNNSEFKDGFLMTAIKELIKENWKRFLVFFGLFFFGIIFIFVVFLSAPAKFPKDSYFVIKNGETLSVVADKLKDKNIIRSPFWFKSFATIFGLSTRSVTSGDYRLSDPESVVSLAWRLTNSDYDLVKIKITIPEGTSVKEMADIFAKHLPEFDKKDFIKKASPYEGFLFPDTYSFLPNMTSGDIVETMRKNFDDKMALISKEISAFRKSMKDIIIMASILEEEGRTMETRRMISGILWKRLSIGMPLQVDAVFPYINGKNTYNLTTEDLMEDSPYNTYTRKGLPIGPITNPGLDAIFATVTPVSSKYFYYLSDRGGNMHYAVTHDGHLVNKEQYLR